MKKDYADYLMLSLLTMLVLFLALMLGMAAWALITGEGLPVRKFHLEIRSVNEESMEK